MTKVTILIPCYNESKTILEILRRVSKSSSSEIEKEVIVVDDGSTDDSVSLLEANPELYSKLIALPKNGGKGAAVIAGLKEASGDYILFQDADLEYDPEDYSQMFRPILNNNADIVYGSRFLAPSQVRVFYFWHKIGNYLITLTFNILHNTTFSDIYSCYLMYRKNLVDPLELKTKGWEQHAEILSMAVRKGKVFYEVPVSYSGRTYEEGKKIRAIHIIKVIKTILLKRFF